MVFVKHEISENQPCTQIFYAMFVRGYAKDSIIYTIDGFILLINKTEESKVNNPELRCLVVAIFSSIVWFIIFIVISDNHRCDLIIGPADSGLFLAMLIAVLINIWKVKILNKSAKNDLLK